MRRFVQNGLYCFFLMCVCMGLQLSCTTAKRAEVVEMPGKDSIRLALMHGMPQKWNVEANFSVFLECAKQADEQNADLLITPECWLDGYASPTKESTPEKLRGIAQDLETSSYLQRVAQKAREYRMYICFGFTSLEQGKIYNAAGLWNDEGELLGVYHKTHLQNHDLQYSHGEALPVWSTPWGKTGIMICADRRWPETARTLRLQGARFILNPTYGFYGDFNEAMLRTRAYENQCYIAFTHPKQGLVTNPKGGVEAKEESDTPGVLVCDLNLKKVKDDNHLADRRPDLYGPITEQQ